MANLVENNGFGYGCRLINPEGFIRAVIKHFFSPVPIGIVDWENLIHEARVALFEQDLKQGESIPETTSGYWWRVARAVAIMLREDYNIETQLCNRSCRPFGNSYNPSKTDEFVLRDIYLEKQRKEPTPHVEVEAQEWFEHYVSLAEGVILDNKNTEQGQRDVAILDLWINGYSAKEISEKVEIHWLKGPESVDLALRRIIRKLRDFFGTESDDIFLGRETQKTSFSQKKNFAKWYSNSKNRERHRKNAVNESALSALPGDNKIRSNGKYSGQV